MTAPGVRGWCPGLHTPMEAADGWLVRVRPPLGRLSGQQAHAIARAARTHGNGLIELTSRGNLQLRGLTPDSARAFARDMQVAGLASTDAATEARRGLLLATGRNRPARRPRCAGCHPRAGCRPCPCHHPVRPARQSVIAVECGGYVPTGTLRADITLQRQRRGLAGHLWYAGMALHRNVRGGNGPGTCPCAGSAGCARPSAT
ncbi:hypothetical protein RAA17_04000 [Komagataeibacter rhaeticus]|nr:hypothetical protein [Komagataeibacter rhaeticus]